MTAPRLLLHVFATFGAGGPQVRATHLIGRLGAGWRHRIVPMDGNTAAAARLPPGAAVEVLPAPPRRSFAGSVRAFVRLLRAERPDLLLTYNWGAIEAVVAARWLRLPAVVHHEEGFGPEELQRRLWRRACVRRVALRSVPAVVVVATAMARIARREWGLAPERVLQLPNGVDCERFRPAPAGPAPAGAAARPFTVGSVGGLRAEKDHATLVRALAAMRAADARLLLVGDGPERPRLHELAAALGVADRVVFAGAVTDPAASYRAMDVFALPSRTEQMPLAQLEAMASGLPVAGSDVGEVRAVLPPESRGALVAPGDAPALAAALDALAADPERRRREGAANRLRCLRDFELDACLDRFAALYERVAAARP